MFAAAKAGSKRRCERMLDVCNGRFSVLEIILEDRLYKTVDTATGSLAAVKRWESGDLSLIHI